MSPNLTRARFRGVSLPPERPPPSVVDTSPNANHFNTHTGIHDPTPSTDHELRDLALQQMRSEQVLQNNGFVNLSPGFNATLKTSSLPYSVNVCNTDSNPVIPKPGFVSNAEAGAAQSRQCNQWSDLQAQLSSNTVVFKPLHEISPTSYDSPCGNQLNQSDAIHNPSSNKYAGDFSEDPLEEKLLKNRNYSVSQIVAWILLFLAAGCLIPATMFAINGSAFSTANYFKNAEPEARVSLFGDLANTYDLETPRSSNDLVAPKFDGIVYSPLGVRDCSFSQEEANQDVLLLSRITSKIRTYSTRCNQARYLLEAIQRTKVQLTVSVGVWIGPNQLQNMLEMENTLRIVEEFPEELIKSIFVGNEVRYRNDIPEEDHINLIKSLKHHMATIGKKIPVGTSEHGSAITSTLAQECDIIGVNTTPFHDRVPVHLAADWILELMEQKVRPLVPPSTQIVISELGWPYNGGRNGAAKANPRRYNRFLKSWLCQAAPHIRGKYEWYYFEAFDEEWRSRLPGKASWDRHWGIFSSEKQLKANAILPVCR